MFNPEYIKKHSEKAKKTFPERRLFDVMVYIKDELSPQVDIDRVIKTIEKKIPKLFFFNIEVVYVGDFDEFYKDNRNFNAMYEDGALYVSNHQDDEEDMIDDIVHEIGHAAEDLYREEIYADNTIKNEFLGKRKRLYQTLKHEDLNPTYKKFLQTTYDRELDKYFYEEVGYATMASVSVGLFYSPYAVTSLREYFANGFENFFLSDSNYLKDISPLLYKKINNLVDKAEQERYYEYEA